MTHLNDISKVYLESIAESAVPGKPAERLGAVTAIPKSEQDAARERLLAKAKAKREKMQEERNDEPGEGPRQKYGDMRGLDRSGAPTSFGGKWQSKERKEAGAAALAKLRKEALDPVGQEDSDIDNDGDKDKSDKYLLKRRKAISAAMKKRMKEERELAEIHAQAHTPHEVPSGDIKKLVSKAVKRIDADNDGDVDKDDPKEKGMGEFVPSADGKKKLRTKIGESMSNWRQDLSEVMDDEIDSKKIKEKKVNNKIKINPEFKESIEQIGGTIIEMVEIDELDYVIDSVYGELLDEGYEDDDIEEALEYALIEAKVTFGHDTEKPYQKKTGAGQMVKAVGRLARQKLASKVSGAKTAAKAAVARGARKVAKGALGVARKMEGGDKAPKTTERKPSTYRGAGAGTKEKVSSGSYTPPTKKKAEKPSDPWEGSATTPPKAKSKATIKKTAAPKAKAPAKKKKTSKLDDLLASVRNEEVQIDEKALSRAQQRFMGMVYAVKKGEMKAPSPEVAKAAASMTGKEAKDFAKTKHKGLPEKKEVKEQQEEDPKEKQMLAKKKQMMQRQYMLDKQRLQMQQQGKLPTGHSEKY